MRAPRFSIRSLLATIAIAGVGLAMLRSPSPVWANASYTVAIMAIVAGASSAILRRDSRRAYWVRIHVVRCHIPHDERSTGDADDARFALSLYGSSMVTGGTRLADPGV